MKELKKIITYWSEEDAKKAFNAQHVLTYPIDRPKAVYQDKYVVRQDLTMIKWGEHLTITFALTDEGYKDINKYIDSVKGAFWFDD